MAYVVKSADVLKSCETLAEQKLSGLRPVITALESFANKAEYNKVIEAIEGRDDSILVRRVLNMRKGANIPVQIISFHGDDRKKQDENGEFKVDDSFFTYEDKNGVEQKACRRKFWYESVEGTQGFGTFPMPFELGDNLKQGDQITLNLHLVEAGTRVIQVARDGKLSQAVSPVRTYYPGVGGGFNAFRTTMETLQAVYHAHRSLMNVVKSPTAKTTI